MSGLPGLPSYADRDRASSTALEMICCSKRSELNARTDARTQWKCLRIHFQVVRVCKLLLTNVMCLLHHMEHASVVQGPKSDCTHRRGAAPSSVEPIGTCGRSTFPRQDPALQAVERSAKLPSSVACCRSRTSSGVRGQALSVMALFSSCRSSLSGDSLRILHHPPLGLATTLCHKGAAVPPSVLTN